MLRPPPCSPLRRVMNMQSQDSDHGHQSLTPAALLFQVILRHPSCLFLVAENCRYCRFYGPSLSAVKDAPLGLHVTSSSWFHLPFSPSAATVVKLLPAVCRVCIVHAMLKMYVTTAQSLINVHAKNSTS